MLIFLQGFIGTQCNKVVAVYDGSHVPPRVVKARGSRFSSCKPHAYQHIGIVLFPQRAGISGAIGALQEFATVPGRKAKLTRSPGEEIPRLRGVEIRLGGICKAHRYWLAVMSPVRSELSHQQSHRLKRGARCVKCGVVPMVDVCGYVTTP